MPLQPLSPQVILAAQIRQKIREVDRLLAEFEAAVGGGYEPRRVVEFSHKREPKTKRGMKA